MSFNESIKYNPKSFWSFINSKRNNSSIPVLMSYNDLSSDNLKDSLNLFALYFQSNFSVDSFSFDERDFGDIVSYFDFGSLQISDKDVATGIGKLSNSFKCDNDGLSAFLLKKCFSSFILPLKIIFNKSLRSGYFIQKWKLTTIFPILKSGAKNNVMNYRPISKLTNIAKIFEHIVYDKLYFQLKRYISVSQHGFMAGRSTTTNLSVFTNFCISFFEKGVQIDTIYTDFAKAFDRVPHELLLFKLNKLGFHSNMISWFRHYLTGRCTTVSVDGICSEFFIPTSGIPQGSILGPLLFNIFVNDISHCFKNSKFLMYADDLKIFKPIFCLIDIYLLQQDLDNVVLWSDRNGLPFNISKCYRLTYHRCRSILLSEYKIKGSVLLSVDEILDLGIVFDVKLSFKGHINFMIPKAYSLLAFIRRNLNNCFDYFTKKVVYTSFVRSKLEYASFIWSPNTDIFKSRIEKIQIKFIKFALPIFNHPCPPNIPSFSSPSYVEKCDFIYLKTLETRRNIAALTFLHDVICGPIDSPDLLNLVSFNVPARTLRQSSRFFFIDLHRTEYALNEPLTKAMKLFNRYSEKLDISFSSSQFKFVLNNLL